jgi:hypothetical protein
MQKCKVYIAPAISYAHPAKTLHVRGSSALISNDTDVQIFVNGIPIPSKQAICLSEFDGCEYDQDFDIEYEAPATLGKIYVNAITRKTNC